MKVLRIAHHGVVTAWRERERKLQTLGVDIAMLSARRWNEGGRMVDLDPGGDSFVKGVRTLGRHPNLFIYDPIQLWRALGTRPDIIDIHEEPFSLATAEVLLLRALRSMKTPFIFYSAQNIDKHYPIPFRWFESYALKNAAGAYVCNSDAETILVRKGLRGFSRIVPLGVDTTQFRPAVRDAPSANPVIGYVGRLESHKGSDVLLNAASRNPRWEVRFTGDGRRHADLTSLSEASGLTQRVSFLGFADGEELARRYRDLDVLTVPSRDTPQWLEQFCRVAVEAMASGVPVVASRSGALPDVIGDAGILTPPGDASALGEGVSQALSAPTWADLRARGLKRAQTFTWDSVAEQHRALYRTILDVNCSGRDNAPQVVVIAYGAPEMLDDALRCLGGSFPVTIVDNSSSSATRDVAQAHDATYLDPGANLGFGAGVNVALRWLTDNGSSSDDVLLLNPDARVDSNGVEAMHEMLHSTPQIAAVGATQNEPVSGASARVWWPFPHPARAWIEAAGLGRLNRTNGFAIGSILMLRAEAISAIGRFDERFFLYAEEVDWQKRAVDQGWSIAVAPISATHIGAATSDDGTLRERYFHASAEAYQRKHFGAGGWHVYRSAIIVGSAIRALILPRDRRRAARARLRLYLYGPSRSVQLS